ncbi:MAG TPA: class I SAM-dependent methyltransferase, partial [Oligoflexia bacterium]|nr:class I SAM-dependent methyltransferase [Oligoflexia bacterium]
GGHRVLGIEPTLMAKLATERGIPSIMEFFSKKTAEKAVAQAGRAKVVTATNVFAHIENIHDIVSGIVSMLTDDGLFISESHYFNSLVETLQYDTIYHEHLRYYSLKSLSYLFKMHGLEVIHAKKIPTHGGSIRVVAAPKGTRRPLGSVQQIMDEENKANLGPESLLAFRDKVVQTKLDLYSLLSGIKQKGGKIYGVGAPSRASTLINYVGLDDGILDAVLEIKGSYKIGKYMPGTVIPVLDENMLFEKQPEYALLLSWHIADELMPKLKARGYKGKFIVPLPEPRVVSLDS